MVNLDEILPGRLWIGTCVYPDEVPILAGMGISHVVNLQTDADMRGCGVRLRELTRAYEIGRIELIRRPTLDFSKIDLLNDLPDCVAALDSALRTQGNRVYLHCTAGINRAPTVAAAWLMRNSGMSAGDACRFVDSKRRCSIYLDVLEMYQAEMEAEP